MRCATVYYKLLVLSLWSDGHYFLGPTVGCYHVICSSNYYYICTCHKNCIFLNNKEVYCHQHSSLGDEEKRVEQRRCVLIHIDH